MKQLDGLVVTGNTVVVVEHDMDVVAGSDWIIDIGPGAGDDGGKVFASGPPEQIVVAPTSRTASFLARAIGQGP
jgi:excinuclease ABC subunit A